LAFANFRPKLNQSDKGFRATAIDLGGSIENTWTTENQRLCSTGSDAAIRIVIPRTAFKDPKTGKTKINPFTSRDVVFADLPMVITQGYDFACTGTNRTTMTGEADGRSFTLFFTSAQQRISPAADPAIWTLGAACSMKNGCLAQMTSPTATGQPSQRPPRRGKTG